MRKHFVRHSILMFVFLLIASPAWAARYWILGSGNWSDTAHWSDSSGGSGGFSVPTSTDNVIFDSHSNEPGDTAYTVTVDAASAARDFTFGIPSAGQYPTLAWSAANPTLSIYGSTVFTAGVIVSGSGYLSFNPPISTTKTLTTNAVVLNAWVQINGTGTLQLVDDVTISRTLFRILAGSLDPNSRAVTLANTTGIGFWDLGKNGSALSFYDLNLSGTSGTKTDLFNIWVNVTVTHNLVIAGNSTTNRLLIQSDSKGTQRTITAASVTISNTDFQDIKGAGAGSWDLSAITGLSGDCGGNTDITFTPTATLYWYVNSPGVKQWSGTPSQRWFLGSGGTGGTGRVPLPQDNVIFDSASFPQSGIEIAGDMPRLGKSINWTGVTNTPTFTPSTATSIFGSLTLVSGMTLTGSAATYTFEGRGSYTLTNAGKTWGKILYFDCGANVGTYTLQDDLTFSGSGGYFQLSSGTFDANGKNVTTYYMMMSGLYDLARTLKIGGGTWTVTGYGSSGGIITTYAAIVNLTVTPNTGVIKFTDSSATDKTIYGSTAKTWGNVWFSGTGTGKYKIVAGHTFTDVKIDAGLTLQFTAGTTTTVSTWTVTGTTASHVVIGSITSATHTIASANANAKTCTYCTISYSIATVATWTAKFSSNSGNNTGWVFPAAYYISGANGDDTYDGTEQTHTTGTTGPWKTIARINAALTGGQPDVSVFLNRGETWYEQNVVAGSGTSGHPYIFGAYGSGNPPAITGLYPLASGAWSIDSGNIWKATVTASSLNYVILGTVQGSKQVSKVACTQDYYWYFASNTLYVYSASNPATRYGSVGAVLLSNLVDVNNVGYVTFQHTAFSWWETIGLRTRGASAAGIVVRYCTFLKGVLTTSGNDAGIYSDPTAGSDTVYNSDFVGMNYGIQAPSGTAHVVKNCRFYLNRIKAINANSNLTYSYNHFWGTDISAAAGWTNETNVTSATDGGGNIRLRTNSRAVANRHSVQISLGIDDYGDGDVSAFVETMKPYIAPNGPPLSINVTAGWMGVDDTKLLTALYALGNDVTAHGWSHQDYTKLNAFTIQYTGNGSACTMTIAANRLTTAITGQSDGSVNLNIDLTAAAYDTMDELIAYVGAQTGYSCSAHADLQAKRPGGEHVQHTIALADVTAQSIKASYIAQMTKARLVADEMASSKAWLTVNGFPSNVYVYPFAQSDADTEAMAVTAGYLGSRGTGAYTTYGLGMDVQNIPSISLNISSALTDPEIDARIATAAAKSAYYGFPVMLYTHYDSYTLTAIRKFLSAISVYSPNMTSTGIVAAIRAGTQIGSTTTWVVAGTVDNFSFVPLPVAPTINAGTNLSLSTDILGVAVGNPPDIGAYENQYNPPPVGAYSRSILIDYTQVPADLTDFPVLVSLTDASLKDAMHGGRMQSPLGYDVQFCADVNCASGLNSEVEHYDLVNGILTAWVKVPTVSHSAPGTTIYMFYGRTGIAVPQNASSAVWVSSYVGVWHLPFDWSYALSGTDSTANANNGTVTNALTYAGQIGRGGTFNGTDTTINVGVLGTFGSGRGSGYTTTFWTNLYDDNHVRVPLGVSDTGGGQNALIVRLNTKSDNTGLAGSVRVTCTSNEGTPKLLIAGTNADNVTEGIWHLVSVSVTPATNTIAVYVDGQPITPLVYAYQQTPAVFGNWAAYPMTLGAVNSAGSLDSYMSGQLDEMRIRLVVETAAQALAEYNNQKTGSTFLTFGSEQARGRRDNLPLLRVR